MQISGRRCDTLHKPRHAGGAGAVGRAEWELLVLVRMGEVERGCEVTVLAMRESRGSLNWFPALV